ncbi:hypothetical protein JTB14_022387 [Gonioctena quinquepunctata]|nr:hypothetical protein JTB14_022387 [Gonioctena quinquepunctata]
MSNAYCFITCLFLITGNTDRKKIIETIRRRGNFEYNKTVTDPDKLILCRKPRSKTKLKLDNFLPCPTCKGMFSKLSLRKHHVQCNPTRKKGTKNVLVLSRTLHLQAHDKANAIMKNQILPVLRNDKYTDIIKYDETIIIYGNKRSIKYRSQKHQQVMIRQKLRQAARFLYCVKALAEEITDLASVFHPKYVDVSIKAINEMAVYCEETRQYKAPSTASAIGTLLKFIGATLKIEYIKTEDDYKSKLVDKYLNLLNDELAICVNRTVVENQKERNRTEQIELPSSADIDCLHTYLKKNGRHQYNKLSTGFNIDTWKELLSLTLISVQVFNRRRAGEIERARIVEFNNQTRIDKDNNGEVYNSYKKVAHHYIRFEIRGKLGRGVPVLLSRELESYINLILKHRQDAGVSPDNPFIFGVPNENDDFCYLKATVLLRKYSTECGAKNNITLRGTLLRKHLATTCVTLDLKDSEVTDVANFMSHHEKIHLEHYRQPIPLKDILRMSQLLEKALGNMDSSDEESIVKKLPNYLEGIVRNPDEHCLSKPVAVFGRESNEST